jgi:3-oxoacyl-[acyl-carrier-protein] synthase II
MEAYIRGIANISPQPTFGNGSFLEDIREYHNARLLAVAPDYKNYLQPNQLRRMCRHLKMGVTAAGMCLRDAGVEMPDAIITGTGLGMMEETEKFLGSLLDNDEKLLNPTAFIQSTHNTVGAHIAVMLGCNNYNLTYVHGPVSLENALLDSLMWLEEKSGANILLGGIEEISEVYFDITDGMGFWKKSGISNLELLNDKTPGTLAGEGASFFLLSKEKSPQNYGLIRGLSTRYNPEKQDIAVDHIGGFLANHNINKEDIDLVILGFNGDPESDAVYDPVAAYFDGNVIKTWYKHLSGEHHLASSFALWLAARILKSQTVPAIIKMDKSQEAGKLRNILIVNHHKNIHHSLILVSSC